MLAAGLAGCGSGDLLSAEPPAGSLRQLVEAASAQSRVPAKLTYAMVQAESHGNPRAVSPAGARGLMQLLPGTARAFPPFRETRAYVTRVLADAGS